MRCLEGDPVAVPDTSIQACPRAIFRDGVIALSTPTATAEKRILKVLKGIAEYHDLTLGDLLEGIVLHAFEGKAPFGPESRRVIADLKKVYGFDLDATASHRLREKEPSEPVLRRRRS